MRKTYILLFACLATVSFVTAKTNKAHRNDLKRSIAILSRDMDHIISHKMKHLEEQCTAEDKATKWVNYLNQMTKAPRAYISDSKADISEMINSEFTRAILKDKCCTPGADGAVHCADYFDAISYNIARQHTFVADADVKEEDYLSHVAAVKAADFGSSVLSQTYSYGCRMILWAGSYPVAGRVGEILFINSVVDKILNYQIAYPLATEATFTPVAKAPVLQALNYVDPESPAGTYLDKCICPSQNDVNTADPTADGSGIWCYSSANFVKSFFVRYNAYKAVKEKYKPVPDVNDMSAKEQKVYVFGDILGCESGVHVKVFLGTKEEKIEDTIWWKCEVPTLIANAAGIRQIEINAIPYSIYETFNPTADRARLERSFGLGQTDLDSLAKKLRELAPENEAWQSKVAETSLRLNVLEEHDFVLLPVADWKKVEVSHSLSKIKPFYDEVNAAMSKIFTDAGKKYADLQAELESKKQTMRSKWY